MEGKSLETDNRAGVIDHDPAYLDRGIYLDQPLRWSRIFSEGQMLVLKSEDFFERSPQDTLKFALDFLHLPDYGPETHSSATPTMTAIKEWTWLTSDSWRCASSCTTKGSSCSPILIELGFQTAQ